jgi:glycosyltransferase involved in cell wall biosynthesis
MNLNVKRLAIFLPALYGGGAERVLLNLAEGLASRECLVDIVLSRAEGPYISAVPPTVNVVKLTSSNFPAFRTLSSLPRLVRYLKEEKPDIVFSALHANIIAIWAKKISKMPMKVVISEHNTLSFQICELPKIFRSVALFFIKKFYPQANQIIVVSNGVASDLSRVARIPRSRIRVVYNPVITKNIKVSLEATLEHDWFKAGEPPVILSVGRLSEQKDFLTLIHAFARVRKKRNVRLLILGEGEERKKIEASVSKLGLEKDVLLPGFVKNPYVYMAKSAIFVLCSKWEGLPTVLVEALFCGASVIATDCPSGPREILEDGKYGQLVPVGNVKILSETILSSLKEEKKVIPLESWKRFEVEYVVKQYKSILLSL